MIVEIDEDSRNFATIYKRDYLRKKAVRPTECKPLPKYSPPLNILNGPYKEYLNTRLKNQSLPENERSEDPADYLNKIQNKFPHLRNVLSQIALDEKVIERWKDKLKKTVYQVDYSGEFVADEYFRSRLDHPRKEITLLQDWIIPETVQRYTYRNPWTSPRKRLIKPLKIVKPRNNLDPDPKEREILHVTTGNSEYADIIGSTGEEIMCYRTLQMRNRTL